MFEKFEVLPKAAGRNTLRNVLSNKQMAARVAKNRCRQV